MGSVCVFTAQCSALLTDDVCIGDVCTLFVQVEGFKMNLVYFDLYQSKRLEDSITCEHAA